MESRLQFTVEHHTEESHRQSSKDEVKQEASPTDICQHFLLGRCHFGDRCRLSHSLLDAAETADSEEEKGKVKCMNQETRAKTSAENQLVKKNNKGCNKKPRMRTADDVISRIIWDSAVDPADFVVGHLDRFLGVLERPFSDFSWDTQVCDCDYSEELALPRHRIQYFSYKGQRVWDRDSRTDRVFGSTGQSILPPFGSEDEKMIFKQETGQQDEDPNQADVVEDLEKATLTENAEDSDKEVQHDANPESLAQELLIPPNCNEEWKDPQRDLGTELPSNAPQEQRSGRPPPRKPTHFVCFRVDSPAALQAFRRIQKTVLSHLPESEPSWIIPETLHVTLCLLVLKGPEEISAAAELLRAIIRDFYKPPISVSFTPKLKHFNGTVLHVTPQPISDIQSLNAPLQEAFKEKGWLHRHSKCPTYHLTLAKMKEPMPEKIFDGIGSIKLAKDVNFGKLEVHKLYLCVINQPLTESGFYQSVCAVALPDV